jgi:hypothetical protein
MQPGECLASQGHISAPVIALRLAPFDDPGIVEHIEVMSEEVSRHLEGAR